jgi:hypothetical protein
MIVVVADYRWLPTGSHPIAVARAHGGNAPLLGTRGNYFLNPLVGRTVKA